MKPVIIGAGLAGLMAALTAAPLPVIVLSSRKLGAEGSSIWAQGGIAAAVGSDDSAGLHAEDTLKAAAGLGDPEITHLVTEAAAGVIDRLIKSGVAFDRDTAGHLLLGLEAAHSRRRIVHAQGDGTGLAVMQALIEAVRRSPSIEVWEDAHAVQLVTQDNRVQGVAVEKGGMISLLPAASVVLATGGAGALWRDTTNPPGSWGAGLALAARAGAALGDLEFMQFHPTAMAVADEVAGAPMPLASEALRGEGCTLIDETGARFTDELQPRDIVARAIAAHRGLGHQVSLDARQALGQGFAARFPAVDALCRQHGIDPATQPIPVRPAAHYHMGGVATDAQGRTSVEGLWACGEVACTGLHGANRLASNSLLEAVVFGREVGGGIRDSGFRKNIELARSSSFFPNPESRILNPALRSLMTQHLGVVRNAAVMRLALAQMLPLAAQSDQAMLGVMIAVAALRRQESRGAHARTDYPQTLAMGERYVMTWAAALRDAEALQAFPDQIDISIHKTGSTPSPLRGRSTFSAADKGFL